MPTTITFRTSASAFLLPLLPLLTTLGLGCPAFELDNDAADASMDVTATPVDDNPGSTGGTLSVAGGAQEPFGDGAVPSASRQDANIRSDDEEDNDVNNQTSCDSAFFDDPDVVIGSGNITERLITVPYAARMHIGAAFVGDFTVDSEQQSGEMALRVRADDNILPYVSAELRDGLIDVGLKGSFCVTSLSVSGTVGSLSELTTSGVARVKVRNLAGPRVLLRADGASRIEAQGRADDWTIEAFSTSQIALEGRAERLQATAKGASQLTATKPTFEAGSAVVNLGGVSSARLCARDQVSGSAKGLSTLMVACEGSVDVDGPSVRE